MGISVDPPEHNAPMREKLRLPFPLLSDARGELAKSYGIWNDGEGVAVPSIIVLSRSGEIRYLYAGTDFADRPGDEEIFSALDELGDADGSYDGEPEVRVSGDEADEQSVRPERPAITLEQLIPYYRGVYFTTVAFKKRFSEQGKDEAAGEVDAYQALTSGYSEALAETRKLAS